MRRRLLWILLLALLASTLVLIARQAGELAGLRLPVFSTLIVQIALLIFIGGMMLTAFRGRVSAALEAILIWLAIAALVVVGYTYRGELTEVGDRVLAHLVPGHVASHGRMVEVARGRAGDFSLTTRVNGARVAMALDTGASVVMLTHEAAKAAGFPLEVLKYSVAVETANGRTLAAPVTIDRLAVGNIVERAVPALIAPPGRLSVNLLGMTFLNRLQSWEVRGDRLLMRGYP